TISENSNHENDAVTPVSSSGASLPTDNPNYSLLRAGLRKARGIKRNMTQSQNKQVTILLYLYNHPILSMPKLRSMMNLSKITSWRIMGRLKRCRFVRFSGSHKNGGYVITQEGKNFIEQNGKST
ncbi:MAG: hypothetical protein AABZ32_03055, partial [Bacteroidota bacterium]